MQNTERFENEPETEDVEGHRLMNDDEDERKADRTADRNVGASPDDDDFEAHRLVDRNADRNID